MTSVDDTQVERVAVQLSGNLLPRASLCVARRRELHVALSPRLKIQTVSVYFCDVSMVTSSCPRCHVQTVMFALPRRCVFARLRSARSQHCSTRLPMGPVAHHSASSRTPQRSVAQQWRVIFGCAWKNSSRSLAWFSSYCMMVARCTCTRAKVN